MADVNVGTITARLTADTTEFTRNLVQATQALQQFQAQVQTQSGQVAQGMARAAQGTQQFQQQLQLLNQQVISQTGILGQISAQLTQLQASFQQTGQAAQQAGQAMQQARQQTQGLGDSWSTIFAVAGGVGLATSIQGIVGAMRQFAESMVEVGTRLEQTRASLSALAGSAPAGQQQFQQLFQVAQQLGVAFDPLVNGWRRLTAAATQAGLPLADQWRLLQALSTETRRLGLTNAEFERSILAVSQMASKGVVSMEELRRQLGDALPTAMAAAARGMGRTTEEVIKLVETGTVRFPAFARAFTAGLEELQRGSGQMMETSQTAFNQLGNAMTAFKDAMAQNVLPELRRIAAVAQTILETGTKILNLTGGRGAGGVQGPSMQDLGASAQQQQELERLNRVIALYQGQQGLGTPTMQEQRRGMLERAQQERDALLETIKATQDQEAAQAKVNAATNQAADNRRREADYTDDLRKKLDDVRKAQEELARQSQIAPNRFGAAGGTTEQQITDAQERQRVLQKQLEDLAKLAANPPAGVRIPDDLLQQIRALDTEYGKLDQRIDALRDKERERERAAREAERLAQQAVTQRIQIEEQLNRAGALTQRPTQSAAEQAAQQVRNQFDTVRTALERAAVTVSRNPNLRDMAQPIQEALSGLGPAMEEQSQIAFARVQQRQQEQVREFGASLTQLGRSASAEGLTPLQDALEQVTRTFEAASSQLEKMQAHLTELGKTGTPEVQAATDYWLKWIEGMRQGLPALQATAEGLARLADQMRQTAQATQDSARQFEFLSDLRQQVEDMQQLPETGQEAFFGQESQARRRVRLQAERTPLTDEGRAQLNQLLQQMQVQEKLNYTTQLFEQFAGSVGQAWTSALTGIADGTRTVSEAFREMARSILQSLAQIASQEAFKALIKVGVGIIAGAFGTGGITANPTQYSAPIGPQLAAQGGAIINQPTHILAGENPMVNPEIILNKPQLQALMGSAIRAAPTAGGQAAGGQGVTIMNFPSKQAAEAQASKERSLGRQVVLNEVMNDLSKGEGSQINRALRAIQR